jgi:hypothetical protein
MALQPGLFNITSATTTTILEKDTRGSVSYISIANVSTSFRGVYVSLFLDDDTNQTYFFKKRFLHRGESIVLSNGVRFNNSVLGLKLTTETVVSTTDTIEVNVIT